MPTELVPSPIRTPALRVPRALNRAITTIEADTIVRSARVREVVAVTRTAIIGASEISLLQQSLELARPSAASRLNDIADAGIAALQAQVLDLIGNV